MNSLNEALVECVRTCGGSKKVGPLLWPEKAPDAAQRTLLDCLNDDRPAHLTPDQAMLIFRLARDKGYHDAIDYVLESLGYAAAVPIEPKDEAGDLMRQVVETQRILAAQFERLSMLQPHLRAAA